VDRTPERFVSLLNDNTVTFNKQTWGGFQIKYVFENYNNLFTPTLGMKFYSLFSWVTKMEQLNQHLPALASGLHLTYKLVPNASVVFETKLETKALLSNNFEFYQGATIGGDFSLRGFRAERFNGKQSFFQSSDVKFNIGTIKNPFVPIKYGCILGFDYGRVWFPSESSTIWHNSLGGGVWFMNSKIFTSHISYFHSSDGGRLTFGVDFNF
jgi:outer membrane protein assembly factor BamA